MRLIAASGLDAENCPPIRRLTATKAISTFDLSETGQVREGWPDPRTMRVLPLNYSGPRLSMHLRGADADGKGMKCNQEFPF